MRRLLPLLALCTAVAAQDDTCPGIVSEALEATDSACADVERNQACYGNLQVELAPEPEDMTDFEPAATIPSPIKRRNGQAGERECR